MKAHWLVIHHLDLPMDENSEHMEKEKIKTIAKEANVIFYYTSNKVFFFLLGELLPNLTRQVDVVCFIENLSTSPSERNNLYNDQINQLATLSELRKQKKVGRIICINPTSEYLQWKNEPKTKDVEFFPLLPCEIAAYKILPLKINEKKEFFSTYHRWGNPDIFHLRKYFPIVIAENSGQFPPTTFCEIINLSCCYIHSSPVGGLRSFTTALALNTPIIIYLTQHPYLETIDLIKESYIAKALSLKNSTSWLSAFPLIFNTHDLTSLLWEFIHLNKTKLKGKLEQILSAQKQWKKEHEDMIDVHIIWNRWIDSFGYTLPAELTPINLILPTYLNDDPNVYNNLFPEGPWKNTDFSLNYPNLQAHAKQIPSPQN